MKDRYFLAMPFVVTACNVLVALMLQASHSHSQPILAEIPVTATAEQALSSLDSYLIDPSTGDALKQDSDNFLILEDADEEDPMLKAMPGSDFKAYVRADIATFYGMKSGTVQEKTPDFTGQAGKFINMSPDPVSLWWDGPNGPVYNSEVAPWGAGGTACFATHQFIFTLPQQPDKILCRFTVVQGTSLYYYDPITPPIDGETDPGRAQIVNTEISASKRSLNELSDEDRLAYEAHVFNLKFSAEYKNFTGGSEWLAMYPPDVPEHPIWRADHFGQEHQVITHETHFLHIPPVDSKHTLSTDEMRQGCNNTLSQFQEYRAKGSMNLTIKALSCAPRVFEIRNFLSDAEVDHILELVAKQNLVRSMTGTTGGSVSETRTSRTTWLSRTSDPILNVVFRRAADVLRMDEALFRERDAGELDGFIDHSHKINEDLQIVHYDKGQQYTAHHDFGYQNGAFGPFKVRSINLCMYLNDVPEGGETSFPRWRNAETGKSIDVKPEKGKAAIFYMKNPDGNLDDLTQHAALPVIEGEKFFANLWISWPAP